MNPARVYQLTMLQLNSNAGVLEVLGAPLTGLCAHVCAMHGTARMLLPVMARLACAPHCMLAAMQQHRTCSSVARGTCVSIVL